MGVRGHADYVEKYENSEQGEGMESVIGTVSSLSPFVSWQEGSCHFLFRFPKCDWDHVLCTLQLARGS